MRQLSQATDYPLIFGDVLAALEAYEIGAIAFAFVGVILVVSYLLEKWGVGLHA
ncbi:hypothetical protein HSRCO_1955 [Halanaeroarchaeum sp. HSR-CO]|uniref:hypothetical protein n=1 Tax=Halanaeroarchaeum sp. HSR-CO TaxID=2866382 RepID=UPI00217CC7EA|nr:hypothetical protein [Halanaeroarchaeum sp. HSR-CO]UWG48232.1 hypothetical protein HSRCO_1955 [Halanaeroarchaeum sp. HSR-CO]